MTSTHTLLEKALSTIRAIHKAFGAPGDYGYGTSQGQALFDLYKLLPEISVAAFDLASKNTALADLDNDIGILLAQLRWLEECLGGETLDAEDQILVDQIERQHKERLAAQLGTEQ